MMLSLDFAFFFVHSRARLLIAIRTEITENVEITTEKNGKWWMILVTFIFKNKKYFNFIVELEPTYPISESSYSKSEEFFLFSTIMEASMIDRKMHDKQIFFELSIGNAGNSIDGHNESQCSNFSEEGELQIVDTSSFNSTTNSSKPITHDKTYYFLPYWDFKPCMNVRCQFPDLRRRMYNSNMISKIAESLVCVQSW